MDPSVADNYTSNRQITRKVTEAWYANNLYCLSCCCDNLYQEKANTPVKDYSCYDCDSQYQLKASTELRGKGIFNKVVPSGDYGKIAEAIEAGWLPHYVLLGFSKWSWTVTDLFVVPGSLIPSNSVVPRGGKRYSTGPKANIKLKEIPKQAFVQIVRNGDISSRNLVRQAFRDVVSQSETLGKSNRRVRQLRMKFDFLPT